MHRLDPASQSQALPRVGLDFATLDYLALATHPAIRSAAMAALGQQRLAAPGPAARQGLTAPVLALQHRLAQMLDVPATAAFSSGSDALRLTLLALLRPTDDVIVDAGAHPAMAEAVLAARARLHRAPAASVAGFERRLSRLARQPRRGRLFMAVPAVSAHASRVPDLADLATLAQTYRATLIVDSTHDLGSMGPTGGGIAEIQGCSGRIDVLLGSFARTFGAAGGYAAFRDPDHKLALMQTQWRGTALSPVNASVILAALDVICGAEGRKRRRNLHCLSLRLRNHLMADGVKVMGKSSPLVPILLPPDTALPRTALLESAGPRVELLQAPVVPLHAPRWRIALSAAHGPADIDDLAELLRDVTRAFDRQPSRTRVLA